MPLERQTPDGPSTDLPPADLLDTPLAGPAVIRGGALRGGAYVVSILLSLVSVPLLTRHLGVVDFGRLVTVLSLIAIVGVVTDAGLANLGVREYATLDNEGRRRLLRNLLGVRVCVTAVGVAAAVVFAAAAGYPDILIAGTAVAGAGVLVGDLQKAFAVPLTATLRLGWTATTSLARQVALVSFVVILVLAGAGLLPFFAAYPASAAVGLVGTLLLTRKEVPLRPSFDLVEWRPLLRDLLPFAVATAITAVRVVIVIMPLLTVAKQTGYFAVSFRIYDVLSGLGTVLLVSAFPVLARAVRDDQDRLRYALQRLFEVATIAGAGIALLTGVGAKLAIDLMAGSSYAPAIPALQIVSAAVVAGYLGTTWGLALLSLRRNRALLGSNCVALTTAVVLSVLLVPDHGAKGAAIAVLVTESVLACLYAVALVRHRPDLRTSTAIVPRVGLAAGAASLAGVLAPVPAGVALFLAGFVYVGALIAVRGVPAEVWDALPIRLGAPVSSVLRR